MKYLLGVNIIHVLGDELGGDVYYQSLKRYTFPAKTYAGEFGVSFIRIDENDAKEIIQELQLKPYQRDKKTVVYQCAEKIRHDKILKICPL